MTQPGNIWRDYRKKVSSQLTLVETPSIKMPTLEKSTGIETCARVNGMIATSHCMYTITIEGMECQVLAIWRDEDKQWARVRYLTIDGREEVTRVPWYQKFNFFLGVP